MSDLWNYLLALPRRHYLIVADNAEDFLLVSAISSPEPQQKTAAKQTTPANAGWGKKHCRNDSGFWTIQGGNKMVTYIRSDLDFILKQIKVAEADAAFRQGISTGDPNNVAKPLFGPGGSIPTYNLSWGLRTVDGTYNNPLHPEWGAADNEFPEPLGTQFKTIMVPARPRWRSGSRPHTTRQSTMMARPVRRRRRLRLLSSAPSRNLIVDQTLGNPSAILTALQRAGIVPAAQQMTVTAQITAAYEPLRPLFNAVGTAERLNAEAQAAASASPNNQALQDAAAETAANLATAQANLDAADDALMSTARCQWRRARWRQRRNHQCRPR